MNITQKIKRSTTTSEALRKKLDLCGVQTLGGYWNWCRSPACDRCRRHHARTTARSTSEWAVGEGGWRCQKITAATRVCSDPDDLLDEVNRTRLALRRAFDRRQRENERWSCVKLIGGFVPEFREGQWTATLRGITHLSRLHEVTFLNGIEPVVPVRLSPFPTCILARDVYDHVHGSIWSTTGLRDCGDSDLSDCFNAINARGGFKALIYRRGLQAP